MFENNAQAQQFGQNQSLASFGNSAQQQQFGQNAARAQHRNQVRQQGYNNKLGFQQWLDQRKLTQHNLPLNQIAAVLGGGQVQQPNFVTPYNSAIPTTDVAGLMQQGYANQAGAYGTNYAHMNNLLGGILGFGANMLA